jgi:hypothetical protein
VECTNCKSQNIQKNLSNVLQVTKKCYNTKEKTGSQVEKAIQESMVVNIVFVWYTRNLLSYLEMTNEETRTVLESIAEYEAHLTDVYGRELFYGDSTLEKLLMHTSNLADEVQEYLKANEDLARTETETENA